MTLRASSRDNHINRRQLRMSVKLLLSLIYHHNQHVAREYLVTLSLLIFLSLRTKLVALHHIHLGVSVTSG